MMLETQGGGYLNVDQARRLRPRWNRHEGTIEVIIEWADGSTQSEPLNPSAWERFEEQANRHSRHVLPSPPGYFHLQYFHCEETLGEEHVDRWPVLMWLLDGAFGFHQVFTAWTSPGDDEGRSAILCPDGRVVRPGDSAWDTEANWVAAMRKEAEEAAAKLAKKTADAQPH